MRILIVDDEIDTGGTIMGAANIALERGAKSVIAACVHPILSGTAVSRICDSNISELVVTDTIPVPPEKRHEKMTVLSIAPLLGEAMLRINSGRSVGELFK